MKNRNLQILLEKLEEEIYKEVTKPNVDDADYEEAREWIKEIFLIEEEE